MPTSDAIVPLLQQFNSMAMAANPTILTIRDKSYRKRKSDFIYGRWEAYFGEETKLENWQKLCGDLGIAGSLSSISKCRKALKPIWVNIWDFLDAVSMGTPVQLWPSEKALAKYTRKSGKIYPKDKAKAGGPSRALLAKIF